MAEVIQMKRRDAIDAKCCELGCDKKATHKIELSSPDDPLFRGCKFFCDSHYPSP